MKKILSLGLIIMMVFSVISVTNVYAEEGDITINAIGAESIIVNGETQQSQSLVQTTYKDGVCTIEIQGKQRKDQATVKSVYIDGVKDPTYQDVYKNDGENLPTSYSITFDDGEKHIIDIEFGYKLKVRTWYLDYEKSRNTNSVASLEGAQVDPTTHPAQYMTYVISTQRNDKGVFIQPAESGIYVNGVMGTAFGYTSFSSQSSIEYTRIYNEFPFIGVEAPKIGNNTYGYIVNRLDERNEWIEWPVRINENSILLMTDTEDEAGQYHYEEEFYTGIPTNGSPIFSFGKAKEGYRYVFGYAYAWGTQGYDGEDVYRYGYGARDVDRLNEFLGLTIQDTGEVTGILKLRDELQDYDFYLGYKMIRNLHFDANGGTGTMDSLEFVSQEEVIIPENTLTREGYHFVGWNTEADGTGETYQTEDVFYDGINNLPLKETTLYAMWEMDEYTVIFVDHDGTVLDEQSVPYGEDAVAPTTPTRDGHEFREWDIDFTNVKSDLTVTALYDEIIEEEPILPPTVDPDLPPVEDDVLGDKEKPEVPVVEVPEEPQVPVVEDEVLGDTKKPDTSDINAMNIFVMTMVIGAMGVAVLKKREE